MREQDEEPPSRAEFERLRAVVERLVSAQGWSESDKAEVLRLLDVE